MKCAVETSSGAVADIPSFRRIGSVNQKLMGGIHRHTDSIEIS
jgi:hypothetical protein